ncbi:unnamed protein product [Arctogadus glacialis]
MMNISQRQGVGAPNSAGRHRITYAELGGAPRHPGIMPADRRCMRGRREKAFEDCLFLMKCNVLPNCVAPITAAMV